MKILNTKYYTTKIQFYKDISIEIRKFNSSYSLYVDGKEISNIVSDFSLVEDYIFCHSQFYSLIYYSFKTKEIHQIDNIGDYSTYTLRNDKVITCKYIEETSQVEAYKVDLKTKKIEKLKNAPPKFLDIKGLKFSTDNKFKVKCKSNNWQADISELNLGKIFHIKCIIDTTVITQTNKNLIGLNVKNGELKWAYEITPHRMLVNQATKILISPICRLQIQNEQIKKLNSELNFENKAVVNIGSFDIDDKYIYFPIISKSNENRSIIEICKARQKDYSIVEKIELYKDELLNHTKQLKVNKNKIYVISQGNQLTTLENE